MRCLLAKQPESLDMQQLTTFEDKIIRIADKQVLRDVNFRNCTLLANPASNLVLAENVHCTNCTFLYDGMEVDSVEWIALMRRVPPERPQNGPL